MDRFGSSGGCLGDWLHIGEPSAAGGAFLFNPDRTRARVSPALVAPPDYFEMRFSAKRGVAYHVWVRLASQNNSVTNDSVHLQFSDSVNSSGLATARIGTTGSLEVLLQDGSLGAAPAFWGWADNGWGVVGTPVFFANDGTHVLRVHHREDGAGIDQVVLSPVRYAASPPGALFYDITVLPTNFQSVPVDRSACWCDLHGTGGDHVDGHCVRSRQRCREGRFL